MKDFNNFVDLVSYLVDKNKKNMALDKSADMPYNPSMDYEANDREYDETQEILAMGDDDPHPDYDPREAIMNAWDGEREQPKF